MREGVKSQERLRSPRPFFLSFHAFQEVLVVGVDAQ